MKPARRWLQPPQHGMLSLFLFSLSRIPSFLKVTPAIGEFGVAGFVIIKVPSSYSGRREDQAGRHNTRLGFIGPRVTNRRFEQGQRPHRSIWAGTRDAVSLIESRTPVCWGRQGGRSPERRSSALADVTIPAADVFDKRQTEIPPEKLDVPHDPPERVPFDLDLAAFLANFAFETYRSPGRMAWEVQGASDCEVHFKNGNFVSRVFPGVLTVSLLAVEGLPSFAGVDVLSHIAQQHVDVAEQDTEGNESSSNKPDRVVDPSVSMVLSDKEMWSESQTSTKRISPGGRYWGELFSMHVHDPESSVLELWLLDRGDWGAIPQSMRDIFGSTGGHALVGSSKVLLSQVLRSMTGGLEDSWSGWVEMQPVNKVDAGGGDGADEPAVVTDNEGESSERETVKIQLDLRFAPMDGYHFDVPTAPHFMKGDLAGAKGSRSEATGRQEFASELARGADTVPASEQEHPTRSSDDGHSSTASTGVSDSTDPLVSASRNDRRKEDVAMLEMDSPGGSERPVVLREDGMPDWDVLTDRLPRQRKDFELTCFIENHETDTQVYVWMDHATKRLIVAFRGTEAWKDLLTDANFLLDELDHAEQVSILPPVGDLVEAIKNTTASWKKPRIKSLPETLSEEKENMLQNINKVFDNSMDLLRNFKNFSEPKDAPTAASTSEPRPDPGSHEEEILSAVQGALNLVVEPASASEHSILEPIGGAERGHGGKNESTVVASLEHGPDGQPARGETSDGSGDLPRRLEEVKQKFITRLGGDDADSDGNITALALKPGDDGVLASTLAWVQEVAGEQMQAINEAMESVTTSGGNATVIENLAPFLKDQQDMVEATRDLVAKVTEFRGGFEAPGGLDEIQEQGKNIITEKINDLRSMLVNNTTSTDEREDTPKIHSGFKTAYLSVNKTLSAVIWGATDGKPEDWHLFVTGHSLGGALGTLAALDYARRYPSARVSMYNFGSPRVGNRAFAKVYDSFVGDSFRVVNNMDVVARMPRGTMGRLLLDYRHAGRTVMVDEDPVEPAWIEGESEGECPLDEDDPVTSILAEESKATEFLSNELKMMEALFTGKGIDHHLEPCYFSALDSFYTKKGGIETA